MKIRNIILRFWLFDHKARLLSRSNYKNKVWAIMKALWSVYDYYLEPHLQEETAEKCALGTDHVCSAERLSGKPKEKEMQTTGNINRWQIRRLVETVCYEHECDEKQRPQLCLNCFFKRLKAVDLSDLSVSVCL